jgi:hypothetical protein
MPDFAAHSLEPAAARVEVAELRTLLVENADLKESVVRNSFRERLNASALIGHYNPAVQRADRLAFEFPLFGDFRCDLAIGDSVVVLARSSSSKPPALGAFSSRGGARRRENGAHISITGTPKSLTGSISFKT